MPDKNTDSSSHGAEKGVDSSDVWVQVDDHTKIHRNKLEDLAEKTGLIEEKQKELREKLKRQHEQQLQQIFTEIEDILQKIPGNGHNLGEEHEQEKEPIDFPEREPDLEDFDEYVDGKKVYKNIVQIIRALAFRKDKVRQKDIREKLFELYPNIDYTRQTLSQYIHRSLKHLEKQGEIKRNNGSYSFTRVE